MLTLAWLCGLSALESPLPALIALGLLLVLTLILAPPGPAWRRAAALGPLAFLVGLAMAWRAMPQAPAEDPAWLNQKIRVTALVREAQPREGGRLRLVLDQVRPLESPVGDGSPTGEETPPAAGENDPPQTPPIGLAGHGPGENTRPVASQPYRGVQGGSSHLAAGGVLLSTEAPNLLPGRLVLHWDLPTAWPLPGQRFEAKLKIRRLSGMRNPGVWDYEAYWAREGVFYSAYGRGEAIAPVPGPEPGGPLFAMRRLRLALRQRAVELLGGLEMDQGRAVLLALLMGDRSFLSPESSRLFEQGSLAHSLAQSGLHLGCVALLGLGLAWGLGFLRPGIYLRVPRAKLAVLLAAPLALGYLWLGQGQPSLSRAAVMFAVFGLLLLRGRSRVLLDGLFLALLVLLALDPLAVHELGLQLSALAVAGIALLASLLASFWPAPVEDRQARRGLAFGRWLLKWMGGLLAVSVAVNLTLLPPALDSFGRISPHLPLNLLWLPALTVWVLPLGLAGLGAAMLGGLGQLVGGGAGLWLARSLDHVAQGVFALAARPCAWLLDLLNTLDAHGLLEVVQGLRPLWPAMLGYWLALLAVALAFREPGPDRRPLPGSLPGLRLGLRRGPQPWAVLALAALPLLFWPSIQAARDAARPEVSLRLLDVGQGLSALATLPGERRVLVDGGGTNSRTFDIGEAIVAPALTWNRPPRLDWLIMSHPDRDHAQGLLHPLRHFLVAGAAANSDWREADGWPEAMARLDRTPEVWEAPRRIPLGPDAWLEALHPSPDFEQASSNLRSLVLRLVWRGKGLAVLPGDAEAEALEHILARGPELSADVLVLPHHGSRDALSEAFYRAVSPRLALVSLSGSNIWGLPHVEVVEALARLGVPLLRTDREGALEVVWDESLEPRFRPQPPSDTLPALLARWRASAR